MRTGWWRSFTLVSSSVPPFPARISGVDRIPFLWLGVHEGSGASDRNNQDVGKRCSGGSQSSGSRLLQLLVLGPLSDRKMEANYRSFDSQSLHDPNSLQGGDSGFSLRVDQKKGYDVLDRSEGCELQIPIHLDSQPYLWITLSGRVYQFKVFCFGLSIARQVFTRVFSLASEWVPREGFTLFDNLMTD